MRPRSGSTNTIREPHIEPSEYQQQLDAGSTTRPRPSSIRYWSDYNRIFYHPRSLVQLQNADLNQSPRSFERFETGEELFATLNNDGELLDRDLRPFLEECDQIQGIQIISGVDDAWGGFSARYLDAIRDELGKTCLFFWGLEDGSRKEIVKTVPLCAIQTDNYRRNKTFAPPTLRNRRYRSHLRHLCTYPSHPHHDHCRSTSPVSILASSGTPQPCRPLLLNRRHCTVASGSQGMEFAV